MTNFVVRDPVIEKLSRALNTQTDKAERLQALNAELLEALEWALPLAEITLEDTRQKRLQAGHDDIGRENKHPGLWPEEMAAKLAARAAIAKAREE